MNREIKFRFVDETGTIYGPLRLIDLIEQVNYCTNHPDAPFIGAENNDWLTLKEFLREMRFGEIIVEQYTGLDERNGKEIYEGDIIEEEISTDGIREERERYIVEWDEVCLNWHLGGSSSIHDELWETNGTRKVVGNIHEKPELLRAEKGEKE